jgi:hypothetical protein
MKTLFYLRLLDSIITFLLKIKQLCINTIYLVLGVVININSLLI